MGATRAQSNSEMSHKKQKSCCLKIISKIYVNVTHSDPKVASSHAKKLMRIMPITSVKLKLKTCALSYCNVHVEGYKKVVMQLFLAV